MFARIPSTLLYIYIYIYIQIYCYQENDFANHYSILTNKQMTAISVTLNPNRHSVNILGIYT